jgi:multidrug efflux pump subunit AcrA (membrane-fusion protein)
MKKINILFILIIALLTSCSGNKKEESKADTQHPLVSDNPDRVVGIASIEPKSRLISLYAETGGIVKQIVHDIDDNVKAGEIIVELVSDVEQAQLEQAQSKLATQQAVVESAKSQSASLKVKSENAKVNYDRNNNLIQSGGVTKQALDDSKFLSESSLADFNASLANITQQENRLKELQADIHYNEALVARKKIKAPVNGKVLSMDVKIGNNISSSQSVCDFAPEGPLMAITEVDELFASDVKVGMRAYIRPQGRTDTLATGKIILTSPYLRKKSLFSDGATNMEDRRVCEVRVLLDDGSKVIIGSRVECVILLK